MTTILLFSRANHPVGWGNQDGKDTAHGYSIIAVEVNSQEEEEAVLEKLQYKNFVGISDSNKEYGSYLGPWFGGVFELIARFNSTSFFVENFLHDIRPPNYGHRFNLYGDNKYFGLFTAKEILEGE